MHTVTKLNNNKIENLNKPTTCKKIEPVIKNFPTNQSPGPDCYWVNSTNIQGRITPILSNLKLSKLKLFKRKGRNYSKLI